MNNPRYCSECYESEQYSSSYVLESHSFGLRNTMTMWIVQVRLAATSCVTKDIKEPGDYGGFPAVRMNPSVFSFVALAQFCPSRFVIIPVGRYVIHSLVLLCRCQFTNGGDNQLAVVELQEKRSLKVSKVYYNLCFYGVQAFDGGNIGAIIYGRFCSLATEILFLQNCFMVSNCVGS